jgi:hypothetical protein
MCCSKNNSELEKKNEANLSKPGKVTTQFPKKEKAFNGNQTNGEELDIEIIEVDKFSNVVDE